MRHRCLPALVVLLLAAPAAGMAQGALKSANIRLPTFDADILEINEQNLQSLERSLTGDPEYDAAIKRHEAASSARGEWQKCRRDVVAANRPRAQQTNAAVATTDADLKKLAAEMQEKLKKASSPDEMQRIVAEYQPRLTAAQQPAVRTATVNEEAQSAQIASRCGAEPPDPGDAPQRKDRTGGWAYYTLIERTVAYCKLGGRFKGPDGSIGVEDVGFIKPADKGMANTHMLVYSPNEVAVLGQWCTRLKPALIANDHWRMF